MEPDTNRSVRLGTVLVVSGPSGAGKSTVCQGLLAAVPQMHFSVSCTTRPKRPSERHGWEYYFLSPAEFAARVAAGAFLEHAQVHANSYGTLREQSEAVAMAGRDVLLDIDVQGARRVREQIRGTPLAARCVFVFLGPPSYAELERRLRSRGTDPEEVIVRRLDQARVEMAAWREYDYLVINDRVEQAVAELQAILAATRCATGRYGVGPWPDLDPQP